MRRKRQPEFTRKMAAEQLREAESRGFSEGMNSTYRKGNHNPYAGWTINGDSWDHELRNARERGFERGQELRRQEILRVCGEEEVT